MIKSRWTPRVASGVAIVMAGLVAISALIGPISILPFAVIPLVAGIGILRQRVWSAYGFALYLIAQVLLVPFVLIRSRPTTRILAETVVGALLMLLLAMLFFAAGRALVALGSKRGCPSAWIAVSVICTVPLFFVQAFVIPTGTKEDTLLIGDRILVRTLPPPRFDRGDIVVFSYPVDRRQTLVKRIIGVPGDRIRIVNKSVYRNGATVTESYAVHKTDFVDSYRDNFPSEPTGPFAINAADMLRNHVSNGEVVVPERSYFVLGDNRDSSLNSRYWGFVGFDDLIGKPLLIYDSEGSVIRCTAQRETQYGKANTLESALQGTLDPVASHRGHWHWHRFSRLGRTKPSLQ